MLYPVPDNAEEDPKARADRMLGETMDLLADTLVAREAAGLDDFAEFMGLAAAHNHMRKVLHGRKDEDQ